MDRLIVSFDLETQAHDNPFEGGLDPRTDVILSWAVAFSDGRPADFAPWNDVAARERLRRHLYEPDGRIIIGANLKFDFEFLQEVWGPIPEYVTGQDVAHLCWLLNENEINYKLANLVYKYCGHKMKAYSEYSHQAGLFEAVESVEHKCKQDVEWTLQLYKTRYAQLLRYPSLVKVFENLYSPLIRVVMEMESTGIDIDIAKLREMETKYEAEAKSLSIQSRAMGYYKGLGQSQAFSRYLFEELKARPKPFMLERPRKYRMKKAPLWKCDKEILLEYRDEFPICGVKLAHSRATKVLKSFIRPWLAKQRSGKLYPSIFQTRSGREARAKEVENGTDSGRWACTNPNLYQIDGKSELKSCIVAPPGYSIIYADLSQAELRVMAHVSRDRGLTECYQNDDDLHKITMQSIGTDNRTLAKNCNFGLGYGIGPFKFSRQLFIKSGIRMSEDQCRDIMDAWFAKYSSVRKYRDVIERIIHNSGYVETLIKRRRRVDHLIKDDDQGALRVAVNATIQGSVSDLLGIAMLNIRKNRDPRTRFWFQVYDSVVMLAPDEIAVEEAENMKKQMENAVTLSVPVKACVGIGKTLAEASDAAH